MCASQLQSQLQQVTVSLQVEKQQRQQLNKELQQVRVSPAARVTDTQTTGSDVKLISVFSESTGLVGAAAAVGGSAQTCGSTQGV